MRIQHNIPALNAYRNYNNNVSALSKNLEKLSSGYRINRAGDDAAGLAISEKMRAQITGLDAASKNVKDGISLVKTAEGAMQEIHDMLNRMDYLATQSANGTYDNEVDRANLQKEVESLKSEIDRIADSANFNGINLLDGSMDAGAGSTKVKLVSSTAGYLTATGGATFKHDFTIQTGVDAANDTASLTIKYLDKTGTMNEVTLSDKVTGTGAADVASALEDELKDLFEGYKVTVSGAQVTIEAEENGADLSKIVSVSQANNGVTVATAAQQPTIGTLTVGEDETFDLTASGIDITDTNPQNRTIEVDGNKYEIVSRGQSVQAGNLAIYVDQTTNTLNADSVKQIAAQLQDYGVNVHASNDGTKLHFVKGDGNKGLTLQIGDSADSYNQMKVSIKDMHAQSLGVGSVDISTIEGAQAAIKSIKDAINKVSDVRGTLGATQNRLEHTQNNLSVMKENIQDAESTIRDTDVADEMMSYTKNNILIQSAQAMLAQANQVPQGVLQLLQ